MKNTIIPDSSAFDIDTNETEEFSRILSISFRSNSSSSAYDL